MNERAIKLYGTEEPPPVQTLLTAGPLTATFEDGQLRWIKIGETEVIRAIAFLIRDRNWSTAIPEIEDLRIDQSAAGFNVTFTARCPTIDGSFVWRGEFTGKADGTLRCVGVGSPVGDDFQTGRTGFVILHPLAHFVGGKIAVEHVDGAVTKARVPEEIVPDQPWLLVRAITHEPVKGVTATIRMEGETWETEDHRNWTDASFKTYCRPLSLPFPYAIAAGEEVRQTVTLTFAGTLPKEPAQDGGAVTVKLGGPAGRMPAVGLSVLPEDAKAAARAAQLVAETGVQHLNCRIDLTTRGWQKPLADYVRLAKETGADVVLEVVIPGRDKAEAEIGAAAKAVRAAKLKPVAVMVTPALDLKSYPPGTPLPAGVPTFEQIAAAARKAFRGARIGGGMLSNFTELNRKRPPKKTFDFIAHATSGLVHAADDRSVMETLETIGHIIRSTRALIGKRPYRIGPSHIGNSFNPYGAAVTPNPRNGRGDDGARRSAPSRIVRRSLASRLSRPGRGGRRRGGDHGLARRRFRRCRHQDRPSPAMVRHREGGEGLPLFHVIRGLAAAAGARRIGAASSDSGRVRTVAWRKGKTTHLWLANLREIPVEVMLKGLPKGKVQLFLLDEATFADAARDPAFGDRTRPFKGKTLVLPPFATARLDISG